MSESDETTGQEEAAAVATEAPGLTVEEQALVEAHRSAKAQVAAVAEEQAAARAARKASPDTYIGIDQAGSGQYLYVSHPDGVRAKARPEDGSVAHRDVTVVVDGRRYEHVATDVDGIWLYR